MKQLVTAWLLIGITVTVVWCFTIAIYGINYIIEFLIFLINKIKRK